MLRVSRLLDFARPRRALPPRAAYELWAASYPPFAHNPLMALEQEVVECVLGQIRATRALDVGTGSGRYLPLLASTGAAVLGLDFSQAMLTREGGGRGARRQDSLSDPTTSSASYASSAVPSLRAPLVCADACHLPFRRAAFDLINASLMVGDVADLDAWAREMTRALGLGGHLVYSDFHPSWAQRRWRRTFQSADGRKLDVSYVSHSMNDHLIAMQQAGLQVTTIREPRFRDDADPAVRAFRRRWDNPPVVVVFHAVKVDTVRVFTVPPSRPQEARRL